MTAFPDHYAALGIDPTADQEVIVAAYRALAKKYHPDTGATRGTASAERFAEIQQAYEVLGSAESRRQYDLELLEATKRELDEHLAAKQRKLAGATGMAGAEPPPPPDLGVIRPEQHRQKPGKAKPASGLREMGPFIVVSLLLMAVLGGLASLVIGQTSAPPLEEPPLPQLSAEAEPASPPPAPAPEVTPQPAPQPAQQPALPEETPLFGSSLLDEAAAIPPPPVEEGEEEERLEPLQRPASLPAPVPAPQPKARPAPSVAVKQPAPARAEVRAARFSVVIYERYRSGDVIQQQGGVIFTSEARCAQFGENAVLRRLAPYEGEQLRPRIWYECRQSP